MIGIVIQIAISWVLLRLFGRHNLSVLGLKPTKGRILNLTVGLLLAAFCCCIYQILTTSVVGNYWILNQKQTLCDTLLGAWWVLKSILFEELIFRGALLYIAIQTIGITKASFLSAICFGVYHWFSNNVWGNPTLMVIIFGMTMIAGLMFAFAYAKTNSLYLPIGLHFGWNFCLIILFSNGPLGQQILIKANDNQPEGIISLLIFLFQVLALPLIAFGYIKWMDRQKKKLIE